MTTQRSGLVALALLLLMMTAVSAAAAPAAKPAAEPSAKPAADPAAKPITAAKGPLADLLRRWAAEGAAAGNTGDWYDNRDRGHSGLDLAPYPQLAKVVYTDADRTARRDWAFQGRVLPQVVFGNSSTSAGVTSGGSNPRMAYSNPRGLALLYAQYTNNNLYIYPEHNDYDPGRGGSRGYGDVYPTNTPYLIISQGSSGSDRPFMRAVATTLAAFRPEVKRRLIAAGMLPAMIQRILRRTALGTPTIQDYRTGKAHPTVFDGASVNDVKMAEMAHDLRADALPPLARLRVVEEDTPAAGRDYFDVHPTERLGDTPACIARIFRGTARTRRMTVSAEDSMDLDGRPLTFHWAVLRGDPARVRFRPMNESGSLVEIAAEWHERRPIAPGAAMESNRIDIGCFVNNGLADSAPAFVTLFCLDDEARTYDADGRPLEIGYGLGAVQVAVTDWAAAAALLDAKDESLGGRLLRKAFTGAEIAAILKAAADHKAARAEADAAQEKNKQAQAALKKADDAGKKQAQADADAARKAADAATKAADDILGRPREGLKAPAKDLVLRALTALATDPDFYPASAAAIADMLKGDAKRREALEAARRRLVGFGLLKDGPADRFDLTPLRPGDGPATARLTAFERALVEQFNAAVLGRLVYGGAVTFSYKRNYVDMRIALPKPWRDVYRYGPKGEPLGWTRYDGAAAVEMNAAGQIVLEKDARGRCVKAQAVRYEMDTAGADPRRLQPGLLKMIRETAVTEYEYAGDDDWRGRVKTPAE